MGAAPKGSSPRFQIGDAWALCLRDATQSQGYSNCLELCEYSMRDAACVFYARPHWGLSNAESSNLIWDKGKFFFFDRSRFYSAT